MLFKIPMQNLFSSQLHPTGSTNDLLLLDPTLFDNLQLPEGIDKKLVVNCILERHGNSALANPNPDWMRHYIGTWSARRLPIWKKLDATLHLEYNPIENYDRKEDIEEKRTTDRTTSGSSSGSNEETNSENRTENETSLHDVSAENASDYQADRRDTVTGSGTSSYTRGLDTSSEIAGEENTMDTFTHSNRTHGNIGVTTTQQMIQSERDIVRYSLIEEIAEDYRDAFCLDVY